MASRLQPSRGIQPEEMTNSAAATNVAITRPQTRLHTPKPMAARQTEMTSVRRWLTRSTVDWYLKFMRRWSRAREMELKGVVAKVVAMTIEIHPTWLLSKKMPRMGLTAASRAP